MKNGFLATIFVLLSVLCFGGFSCYAASSGDGNVANGGFAISDGTYVFYSADGNLYREDLNGGNKKILLEKGVSSICTDGDYVYYQTMSYADGIMYRIKKDGSNEEFITRCSNNAYTAIKDGYIYYSGGSTLRKRKIGSDNDIKLGETYDPFAVAGNRIYFNNEDSSVGAKGLASMDLDGSSFKSYLVGQVGNIQISGNYIYYTYNGSIYKLYVNDGEAENLGKADGYYINVYNGYVYFKGKGSKLSRISVNGSEIETSGLEINSDLCIVNDKIYSRSADNFNRVVIADIPSFKSSAQNTATPKPKATSKPKATPKPTVKPTQKNDYGKVSDWAEGDIEEADQKGLIPSYFKGKDLTEKITREEFAAVAVQLYEKLTNKTVSSKSTPFKDISRSELKTEIGKAYGLNVAVGISDTAFDPKTDINREQLATMLCRVIKKYKYPEWTLSADNNYHMSGSSGKKFADDNDISDFAKDSVYFMNHMGIIKGIGDNKFAPKNTTSREEAIGYATATREQAISMSNRIHKVSDIF